MLNIQNKVIIKEESEKKKKKKGVTCLAGTTEITGEFLGACNVSSGK